MCVHEHAHAHCWYLTMCSVSTSACACACACVCMRVHMYIYIYVHMHICACPEPASQGANVMCAWMRDARAVHARPPTQGHGNDERACCTGDLPRCIPPPLRAECCIGSVGHPAAPPFSPPPPFPRTLTPALYRQPMRYAARPATEGRNRAEMDGFFYYI